jgi:protein O-GlcNAc transferase
MDINKAIQSALKHHQKGNLKESEFLLNKILKKQPDNPDILQMLGLLLCQTENYDLAIQCIKKALQYRAPNVAGAYFILGMALQGKGLLDEAITHYQKAIELDPSFAEAYYNLGIALKGKGEIDEAITYYQKAIEINPFSAKAYYSFGNALKGKGQLDEAISYYQKAIELNPSFAAAYCNLGITLKEKGRLDEAISCYQTAIKLNPNLAHAYNNLGIAFHEKGRPDEVVIACYRKAVEINPDFIEAYSQLTNQLQKSCQWQDFKIMTTKLDDLTRKALDTGNNLPEPPFFSIIRHADSSLNFAVARAWSRDISIAMSSLNLHFSFDVRRTGKPKIVIGYLSNRFGNTATAHLMLSLFGLHNRDEFSIYCYSYGKDDGSSYRARIVQDSDKFVDISSLSFEASARRINEDQVDILVDLKGHTQGSRFEICALRPAPIQVSYLGFAGSTGADFIDYIITDNIVTPEDHRPYYSEQCVYLPHCYLVNDHTQPISNKDWKKVDFGLPEKCFVFCSFNQPYKIDPIMFDVWMTILKQVPNGILWLMFESKLAENNLRQEAEARGVKPERLIFAKKLSKDEHLSRLRLADLALDTRIVNGHTTTSDALWAGVPVITLHGSHFASRVSSSILSAMGLPQLIAHSVEDYEALAVRLASAHVELQEIRQKIAENRLTSPLFDTPRFVRNLETAYKEMWSIFLAGDAPRQIEVLES